MDAFYLAVTLGVFALSWALLGFFERLRRGP